MQDPVLDDEGKDPAALENKLISQLKLEGLSNSDPDVIHWMDRLVGEEPHILPVKIKKDGGFGAGSSVASSEQLDQLGYFVKRRIEKLADGWMSGEISKNPFLYAKDSKRKTACEYCRFASVCRFDERRKGCEYHRLIHLDEDRVWQRVYEEVKDEWEKTGQMNN